ncbi:Bug family tripartite tricarboxylate transporter substrate binding protein [Rhodoplanes sp. Z2-YC6860]|uniref:Bug family tripartite tricarboxylate transporter substrate binding protein n=1 Tax=Rhodoplanes sp. Z2-YC6860 TaxID=674703 RepID=UPI00078E06AE|nr:tripartite tricarboxylate transporter substrate binding protein [Rhodoplanes sp. Z2-YC6860]AMN39494.1 ABC transporter substrate-binding protein [Rhodoplanes sp. Z2-YC6860]
MKSTRRRFLQLASSAALVPAAPYVARAQGGYPNHPVRIIVGQAAGSSSDITARLIGQWLSEKLNGQFIVEVRPGATGNIATDFVAHAPGDGYTLLLLNAQNTINATLYEKPSFDFQRDIVPVAGVDRVTLVMEVNPSFPAKTVAEFIAYAKANPGKVNMASAGIGGPQHAAGEMFKYLAGVDMVHVPYRGSTPAVTDLLGGQVQVMFDVTPTSVPQIKNGKLRALGVSTPTRIAALPDVPPIAETVKGYEASAWVGIGAPRGTPAEIVALLNKQITASLSDDTIKKRLGDLGADPLPPMSPADFAKFVSDDVARWAKVIKATGMKPG